MQIPKLKVVIGIEGDNLRKVILAKKDAMDSDVIKKYIEEHQYEVTDEVIELGYDNMSMSKYTKHIL